MIDDQWIREKQAVVDRFSSRDWKVIRADDGDWMIEGDFGEGRGYVADMCDGDVPSKDDADGIAEMRNSFPLALQEIRRLREALSKCRILHDDWCSYAHDKAVACDCGQVEWNARIDAVLGGR